MAAPRLWNALPMVVKSSNSVDTFKRQLKSHLFLCSYVNCWPVLLCLSFCFICYFLVKAVKRHWTIGKWCSTNLLLLLLLLSLASKPQMNEQMLRSRITVCFLEQIMSVDKYPSIFLRQMEAIVYIVMAMRHLQANISHISKRHLIFVGWIFTLHVYIDCTNIQTCVEWLILSDPLLSRYQFFLQVKRDILHGR